MPQEAAREHLRIVENQQVARAKKPPEVGERRVLERPASARHHQQPRTPAFGGLLRDQRLGQLEVEVGNVHVAEPKNVERSNRPRAARSGFHRSPAFSIRARTLSRRKSSIATPFSTSAQVSGVDTEAVAVGRTE